MNPTAPSYPVPAVRLIVSDEEGRILIIRRDSAQHSSGAWCLPGGKVDYGDTIETTIRKELEEEVALRCVSARFLFYQDSLPISPGGMHCLNLYFECQTTGSVQLNEESSESAWVSKSKLPQYTMAFRNDAALLRYWRELGESDPG